MNNVYSLLGLVTGQWETIYYFAFIILTVCIAFITIKSYLFQSRKESEICCKCIESKPTNSDSNLYLEIYNHGNMVIKEIKVTVQDIEFGIIPFLKPDESYYIPIAFFIYTMGGKSLQPLNNIKINEGTTHIKVQINANGKNTEYNVDISILKNTWALKEIDTRALEKISSEIKGVATAVNKIKIGK